MLLAAEVAATWWTCSSWIWMEVLQGRKWNSGGGLPWCRAAVWHSAAAGRPISSRRRCVLLAWGSPPPLQLKVSLPIRARTSRGAGYLGLVAQMLRARKAKPVVLLHCSPELGETQCPSPLSMFLYCSAPPSLFFFFGRVWACGCLPKVEPHDPTPPWFLCPPLSFFLCPPFFYVHSTPGHARMDYMNLHFGWK